MLTVVQSLKLNAHVEWFIFYMTGIPLSLG